MKIKEKIPSKSLSRLACLELKKMLISKKSNIVFPLTKRISFIKSYSSFHFEINKKVYYEIVIKEPSKVDNKFFYLDFTKDSSNRNVSNDDYPLTREEMEILSKRYNIVGNATAVMADTSATEDEYSEEIVDSIINTDDAMEILNLYCDLFSSNIFSLEPKGRSRRGASQPKVCFLDFSSS